MALSFLLKHRQKVIWGSLILFVISTLLTIKLFSQVRSEVEYLLPPSSKTLLDVQETRHRYPQSDILLVFFEGTNALEVKRQYDLFKGQLVIQKHPAIGHVMTNLKEEIHFFSTHRLHFYPLQNWKELRTKIFEKTQASEKKTRPEQLLSFVRNLKNKVNHFISLKTLRNFSSLKNLPEGEFVSADGTTRLLVIFHSKPMTNLNEAIAFDRYITQLTNQAQKGQVGEVKIHLSGIAKAMVEEYRSLWADLLQSIVVTVILIFLSVALFFKNTKILIPLFFVLFLGTFTGFGICFFIFEKINSNSAFLCSVVIGNAINTGIVYITHLIYRLKESKSYDEAIVAAFKVSFTPTFISAISACIAFLCLTVNSFRGYYEFGIVGAIGMMFGWLGMIYLLPVFLSLKYFQLPKAFINKYEVPFLHLWKSFFHFIVDKARLLLSLLLGFIFISLIFIVVQKSYLPSQFLERDMTKMKDQSYNKRKLTVLEPLLNKVLLKREFLPSMVILSKTDKEAYKLKEAIVSDAFMRVMLPELKGYTIWDVLPYDEREKLVIFTELKKQNLQDSRLKPNITKNDEKLIDDISKNANYQILKRDDLPFYLKYFFTEADGIVGKVVHLNFNLNNLETDLFKILSVMNRIRTIADNTVGADQYVVGGLIPMLAEMGGMILKDSWKAIVISLVAILLMFFYFYRTPRHYLIVSCTFLLTLLLFILCILLFKIKINILNFIALPLTFGIGVDYSSNIIQYFFSHHHSADLKNRLKESLTLTAPFVFMSSLTTMIGFVSICLSTTQMAIYSFGLLAFIGEVICLFGAFVFLPLIALAFMKEKVGTFTKEQTH